MAPFLLSAEPVTSLEQYLATGTGGSGIAAAHAMGGEAVIAEIARSGLRGRGGGGFPTGQKWSGIAEQVDRRRYLVCNGAEGEPGTFKDRALIRANPYQLVEGLVIAAFAVGASQAYVCLKSGFERELHLLTEALAEFQRAGLCDGCEVTLVAGPDEYLYGEEKAMLEVIEGNEPLPRWLPPHIHGLFATAPQLGWQSHEGVPGAVGGSHPTLVNNVETLANVPHICARGADWFRSMGTRESPGTIVATVVGDVVAPDVGEVEMGTPLGAVIDAVGAGVHEGRTIKAVFSGVANPVITRSDLHAPLSYEGLNAVGSGLGAAGFIVYDDTACMVQVAHEFSRFLSIESCGQCPPCKLGSSAITDFLARIHSGSGAESDLAGINHWLSHVTDGNRCFLPVEERSVIASILARFPEEFSDHITSGRCPQLEDRPIPKLLDLSNGRAIYDADHARKRPDWTYAAP